MVIPALKKYYKSNEFQFVIVLIKAKHLTLLFDSFKSLAQFYLVNITNNYSSCYILILKYTMLKRILKLILNIPILGENCYYLILIIYSKLHFFFAIELICT